jgi:hypothetical protein
MLRGGSWFHVARNVRCANRNALPDNRVSGLGFRPVAEVKAAPESDRMLHSGAWNYDIRNIRCTFRHARDPGRRYEYYGLRPVAEVKEISLRKERTASTAAEAGTGMPGTAAPRAGSGPCPVAEAARPQRGIVICGDV